MNFLFSDVVMVASHLTQYLTPFIVYCYYNYLKSMETGQAIYNFMDFPNDFWGAIRNLVIVYIISILYYIGVSHLSYIVKADFVKTTNSGNKDP